MLGHLIRKEILDHLLSLRFLILSGIGALIIWLSLYDGYIYYQDRLEDYRLAQAATEQRIRQITASDGLVREPWYELNCFGFHEHKPPTPMSIFVRGLDPTLGHSISNTNTRAQRLRRSPAEMEWFLGIFPPLDLGLVVQVVLSLFVLLLTYDAVCGEKEAGTLRLTASFSMPRHRLLIGKCLGVLIPTLAAFGLPFMIGIVVVLMTPEAQITGTEWTRLWVVLIAFGLYLVTFTCAGLLSSCLTHRSATSFVLLLTFWVGAVVVLPRLSLIAADGFRPAPSIHEYQARKNAVYKQYLVKWREVRKQWQQEHSQPGREWWRTPEGREANQFYYIKTRDEMLRRQGQSELAHIDEDFRNRYNARLSLSVTLARLSPAFVLKNAVVRLTGTGIDRHQRFEGAFEVNNRERGVWEDKASDLSNLRWVYPEKYGKPRWDISDMPRFAYREVWPQEDLQAALIDVGVLVLWGVVFFAGAYLKMLRYDVR
ncbi:MAG: hypothetical protein A3F84_28715 [Candidatus Handelsmanbacteria bacterium RIFCSPLOWO2_12_FULL_64_10]|uniref:ABC transporter permease n=1 Tax=Handelsmanbacteria sp. (strain RIFCSPLOWO2_12_FULL_64_10) TaxID=1817868 RepID=A0A1F6D3V2_HANXR|nr:MAG: hypothetical protein A3F84_28715 [Candidatus Handelsmanbacteria bacterium RIFCSPLOWO2_12_FULL_64_10]